MEKRPALLVQQPDEVLEVFGLDGTARLAGVGIPAEATLELAQLVIAVRGEQGEFASPAAVRPKLQSIEVAAQKLAQALAGADPTTLGRLDASRFLTVVQAVHGPAPMLATDVGKAAAGLAAAAARARQAASVAKAGGSGDLAASAAHGVMEILARHEVPRSANRKGAWTVALEIVLGAADLPHKDPARAFLRD